MTTLKTMVVGIEHFGLGNGYPSPIVGLILRGIKKEEIQEILDNHKAVIVRKY